MENKPLHHLEEGREYLFNILDEISLPGDDEYYIITDPWAKKYLMHKRYYEHFGLHTGIQVKCRVDKINCQGKVFMEPEHPFYKIGGIYEFEYLRNDIISRKNGDQYSVMVVRDQFGLEGYVTIFKGGVFANPPAIIRAKVNRIKKARVYLSQVD
jgi:hypothetical protein